MAEPTRIRATFKDGVTDVRMRMSHEMESGQRKDPSGKPIPAWYIAEVTISLNAKPVLVARWGAAVSKNPYLRFRLTTAKPGDKLSVAWTDTRGAHRFDEAAVS